VKSPGSPTAAGHSHDHSESAADAQPDGTGPSGPRMAMTDPPGPATASKAMTTGDTDPSMTGMSMGLATPWAHFFAVIILGLWLMSSPASFDYRDTALAVSDIISGALIIAFAVATLTRRGSWAPWASTVVGLWLLLAPLVFKAPTGVTYLNDTLSGILVISFVLLMPGMPGMKMQPGPDVPSGWSYNPSTWSQRGIIIALAVLNLLLARYLTTYQLGYAKTIWDPFFSPGTKAVLTSKTSKSFPISDAGIGAVSYILEALMGFMGDRARWRTMPWMVSIFGVLVVPVGIVSILLIMLQPVSVGQWCTACLVTALSMLIMVALTLNEVVAMVIFLFAAHREGQSAWRVFWLGGALADTTGQDRSTRPDVVSLPAMIWGTGVPWSLLASSALGVWLLFSPGAFGTIGTAADSTYILGALVVTVAVIAMAEVGRAFRFSNVLIGAALIAAPWLLNGFSTGAQWNGVLAGLALIALSLPRGTIREDYGSWNRYII
jgi:uncharacterized membrane protein